jgi:hypothetical protein
MILSSSALLFGWSANEMPRARRQQRVDAGAFSSQACHPEGSPSASDRDMSPATAAAICGCFFPSIFRDGRRFRSFTELTS